MSERSEDLNDRTDTILGIFAGIAFVSGVISLIFAYINTAKTRRLKQRTKQVLDDFRSGDITLRMARAALGLPVDKNNPLNDVRFVSIVAADCLIKLTNSSLVCKQCVTRKCDECHRTFGEVLVGVQQGPGLKEYRMNEKAKKLLDAILWLEDHSAKRPYELMLEETEKALVVEEGMK